MVLGLFQRFGLGTRKDRYPGGPLTTPTSIRVLKLKSIENNRIDCRLKTIDIAASGQNSYDALSYRWGDIADPEFIRCSGVPFRVQRSLFRALFQIWSKNPKLMVWVDAVCIDQNSFTELSKQVRIMGTIYQRAQRVIVWLGEADEFTDLSWQVLLEASLSASSAVANDLDARLARLGHLEDIWLSVHNLGQREWFYRAWTFQELYLAQRAIVICSQYEMDWDRFHHALDHLSAFLRPSTTSAYSRKARETLQRLLGSVKKLSTSDATFTLTDLLSRTIHRSCDEPKDKIYALLGVLFRRTSLEHSKLFLPIDYRSSTELVYTRVSYALATRATWTEPGRTSIEPLDLGILHGAGLDAHNRRYRTTWFKGLKVNRNFGDLPTWVTDWTDIESTVSWAEQTYIQRHKWRPIINTNGLKLGAAVHSHESRIGCKELLVYGVVLARLVRAKSEINGYTRFDLEDLPRCVCRKSSLSRASTSSRTDSYIRWTSKTPPEDNARYPDDSPSRMYYSPKVLRELSRHDRKACECSRTPFIRTVAASLLAFLAPKSLWPINIYLYLVVCWIMLKDVSVESGKPSRNFCLDMIVTKRNPTAASEGDWIVSLAGEQGLFLLKPVKDGNFKLVRGLLQCDDMRPNCQVIRIDANGKPLPGWKSKYRQQTGDPQVTTYWRDFRVLPVSLSIV